MRHLVSFADSRLNRSRARLSDQAKMFGIFDAIHLFDETDLSLEFKQHFKDRLVLGSRGFGYWAWKPEIIADVLNQMAEGDCLLYLDVGCHLNIRGIKRLVEYFELLRQTEKGVIAFQANAPSAENSSLNYDGRRLFDQPNYRWVKGDLFDYFGVRHNPDFTDSQAIGCGVILLRKSHPAIEIIEEWRHLIWSRFDLLDDTPSVTPNLPGFIEHRHDQAIWSLLCLRHGVQTLSAYEYWYPDKHSEILTPDWQALSDFPIHAKRDKDLGWAGRGADKIKHILNQIRHSRTKVASKACERQIEGD